MITYIPKSVKVFPCWISKDEKYDLCYLTDNEEYFVSIDHKRVYKLEEVDKWHYAYPPEELYL